MSLDDFSRALSDTNVWKCASFNGEKLDELRDLLRELSTLDPGIVPGTTIRSILQRAQCSGTEGDLVPRLLAGDPSAIFEIYETKLRNHVQEKVTSAVQAIRTCLGAATSLGASSQPLVTFRSQFTDHRVSVAPDWTHFRSALNRGFDSTNCPRLRGDRCLAREHPTIECLDALLSVLRKSVASQAARGRKFIISVDQNSVLPEGASAETLFRAFYQLRVVATAPWLSAEANEELGGANCDVPHGGEALKRALQVMTALGQDEARPSYQDVIDFLLSALLGSKRFVSVFDFGSDATPRVARSVIIISESPIDNDPSVLVFAHLMNRLTTAILLFEHEIRTFRLAVQSQKYVLKRDERRWQRIREQVQLYRWAADPDRLPSAIPEATRKDFSLRLLRLLPDVHDALDAQEYSAYRMTEYPTRTFRNLLLVESAFRPEEARSVLGRLLREMAQTFFVISIQDARADGRPTKAALDHAREVYWDKLERRVNEAWRLAAEILQNRSAAKGRTLDAERREHLEALCDLLAAARLGGKVPERNSLKVQYVIDTNLNMLRASNDPAERAQAEVIEGEADDIQRRRTVTIDDVRAMFSNWAALREQPTVVEALAPNRLCLIHGDLHFDNVLIDPTNPSNPIHKLIDPGDSFRRGADVAYDLGKLLHSLDGLYDCLHVGFFDLQAPTDSQRVTVKIRVGTAGRRFKKPLGAGGSGAEVIGYRLLSGRELNSYLWMRAHFDQDVKTSLQELFNERSLELDALLVRARLNQAVHFLTMVPFHIEEDVSRSLAIFVTGVTLFHDWFKTYKGSLSADARQSGPKKSVPPRRRR